MGAVCGGTQQKFNYSKISKCNKKRIRSHSAEKNQEDTDGVNLHEKNAKLNEELESLKKELADMRKQNLALTNQVSIVIHHTINTFI